VEYVKWDMNRPLTEVYSAAAEMGEVWQAEISHRYMLGVYELQQRLTTNFPHVLLENCASGGRPHYTTLMLTSLTRCAYRWTVRPWYAVL
jgi:alpha-galactosidase